MKFTPRLLTILISSATAITFSHSLYAESNNPATAMELPTLSVISATPLPGMGIAIEKYAGNVQVIGAEQIENQNPVDMSEMLFRNISSVDINSAQNNPFQNDVHYRGFLASPLVGSAIGVSTYVDGVRVNEGFGDTVNWDLIPEFAIANISVIPGSNPLFGLNTLGGSLSLNTKNGFNFAGTTLELSAGEDGRRSGTFEHGGNSGNFDWYIGATKFREDGWRSRSPSDVKQLFAKAGWESDTSDIDLSYTRADNDLIGNGFVPESHLDADRESVYTYPDQTENELSFFNLNGSHWLSDNTLVSANAFYRSYERSTLNGDAELDCVNGGPSGPEIPLFIAVNPGDDPTDSATELQRVHVANCDSDEFTAPTVIGSRSRNLFDPATQEAELEAEGENRTTKTETDNWGGTLQFSHDSPLAGKENTFVIGASYDKATTDFTVAEAEGELEQVAGELGFGVVNPEESEVDVDLETGRKNWALFFTDTVEMTDQLALTFAGRYQHTTIELQDKSGEEPELNGDHSFSRFSPAIGLAFSVSPTLTVYSSYNESFRTPTAAELTCADPDDPCNLPNSFVADPPLDPVIGKTIEIGARGSVSTIGSINWTAAAFRTQLEDDLLFTTVGTNGSGFFINVDETQRQGLELGLNGVNNKFAWYANYSFIDATFESSELLASVVDPNGVQVKSGDQLPAIPRHNVKLGADYAFTNNFNLGSSMTYSGSSYMRGDENNKLDKIDSYTVFNINARYQPTKMIQIWVKVDNVFDKEYENSGIRNFNAFPVDGGEVEEERFVSPGAPRMFSAGVKVIF